MRLSKQQIREIIVAHRNGEPKAQIANRFGVDNSTVKYHVEKYEGSYYMGLSIYSVIQAEAQHECRHPSTKCLACGKRTDTMHRDEIAIIGDLTSRLRTAEDKLRSLGLD